MYKYYQILCGCVLVLLLLVNGGRTTPTNIARGKDTASSSPSYHGKSPSIVVDGVTEDSSIGAGSPRNCADCFYIGVSASAHHWIVDLGNQYFTTQVKLYTGKISYTMSDATMLTRGDESPFVDPSDHPDQWNQIYSGRISGEFARALDTAVYARHVAVRVPISRQLVLTEVEVYGYATADFKPTNLQITQVTSDCATLRWDHPNDDKAKYQYKCGSSSWISSDNTRPPALCIISPTAGMTCRVRVKDVAETELSKDISCSDFTVPQPTNLSFGSPTKVWNDGRWRYKYTVTWSVPSYYTQCLHPNYPFDVEAGPDPSTLHNTNSWELYRDGGVYVTVRVWVRNKNGELSTPDTKSTTVPTDIPPQVAPRNIRLAAVSPTCVSLSWDPVLYPNGPESGIVYQHNCNSHGWRNIPENKRVCGFTPNTLISCKIRARRGSNTVINRNSEETGVKRVTTCNDPFDDSSIQIDRYTQNTQSMRKRWRYTVSWKPQSGYNCDKSSPKYRLEIDGATEVWNSSQTTHSFYTDGYVGVTAKLWLLYETGELSSPETKSFTTHRGLPPQVAPINFTLRAVSPYCVSLSWNPVLYPNGPESGIVYQYICNTIGWANIPDGKRVCRFTPNTQVSCRIKARRESNTDGNRDSELTDIKRVTTPCLHKLPSPTDLTFDSPTKVDDSNRKRWEYTVRWQEPETYGCIHPTNPYKIQIDSNSPITNHNQNSYFLYRDGGEVVTVRVWLRDKNEVLSDPIDKRITTSVVNLPPQVAPRNFTLRAVSPYCVSLNWDPVQYPNGPESGIVYQIKCKDITWSDVPLSKPVCGYRPYELARCKIRARRESNNDDNRNSETADSSVRTLCAEPDLPTDLSAYFKQDRYEPEGSDRKRIRVKFNIPDNNITVNCKEIKSKEFRLKGTKDYTDNNQYINNLLPNSPYEIEVKVVNDEGLMRTVTWEITTIELEPYTPPVITRSVSHNRSCVFLGWRSPLEPNGVITRYQHRYFLNGDTPPSWIEYKPPQTENSYISCGYEAGDLVTYQVGAGTAVGYGPEATGNIRVTCGFPSIPEFHTLNETHKVSKRERIRLTVSWMESDPACASISYYNLTMLLKSDKLFHNKYLPADKREMVIDNLDPYTNYTIILIAVNNALNVSSSEPRYILTPELAPYDGPILDTEFNISCVSLTIQEPAEPNGVITHYQISCGYAGTKPSYSKASKVLATSQTYTVCKLRSAEKIECRVTAGNVAGESPVTSVTGYTRFEIPLSKKAGLKNSKNSGKTVPITIYPITLSNRQPSAYRFVVKKLGEGNARRKRSNQVIPEPECDLENSGDSTSCYITADVDSSLVEGDGYQFKVGDGKEYGGYHNAPLEPGQDYRLYQGVTVITEDGTERVEYFKEPIDFYLAPSCDSRCAIGVAVSLVVIALIVVVIVVVIFLRRRKPLEKVVEEDEDLPLNNIPPELPLDNIPPPPDTSSASNRGPRPQPRREDLYDQVDLTSVTLPNLEEYIRQEDHIKGQYEKIKELPKPVMNAAAIPENRPKCRYRGLYPADESRVILKRSGGDDTDFINASYISGFAKSNPGYIAAQGPTIATVDDFWLMIWQQRPKAIVMVTKVLENDRHKCEQYWPDNTSTELKYKDLSVSLESEEEFADFVVRILRVEKNGESRTVKQFHYISWPDHGVPDSMCPFISFYKKVMTETYRLKAPLLIHCSAGVGRTGTFIAMNNLLEQATLEERVDFYECVKKMRENRPSMVQTVEQYVFLHQVVSEFIVTEEYICSPNDIPAKLPNTGDDTGIYSNTASGSIGAEFDRIEATVRRRAIDVKEGQSAANSSKNRDMNVLPPSAPLDAENREHSLRPLISGEKSDYINAVFANAYRKQNQFIATQLPLTNTLTDFWQMVEGHKVRTIVQLEDTNVSERFYPSTDGESPMSVGDFVVIRLMSETNQEVSTISLRITRDNTSRDVRVIKTESWKEGIPENSSMLCYLETLEKSQQKSGNGRVCVMSLDGGARCGMFICVHNAIEKLKCEQEVDIYSTVVTARLRRPQFVARMEYYVNLYDLLREFADRFSDYANFK